MARDEVAGDGSWVGNPAAPSCPLGHSHLVTASLPVPGGMGSFVVHLQECQLVLKLNCRELNLPIW